MADSLDVSVPVVTLLVISLLGFASGVDANSAIVGKRYGQKV